MKRLDIRLAAHYSGIKAHTIRIWEQRYGLLAPQKGAGNRREYSREDIINLIDTALLTKYGYAISRVAKFSREKVNEIITQMSTSAAGADICINKLLKFFLYTDIYNFESALNDFVNRKGLHVTIKEVIVPFIERAELFSYDDHYAASHFSVNILKNKIIAATEQLNRSEKEEQVIVLFLPPAQHFDLILLNLCYQLRYSGYNVIYLGANTSLECVTEIASRYKTELYVTYVSPRDKININDMHRLAQEFLGTRLFIAGAPDNKQRLIHYDNIIPELRKGLLVNG